MTWAFKREIALVDPHLARPCWIEDQELPLHAQEIDALILEHYRLSSEVLVIPRWTNQHHLVSYCQRSTIHFPNSTHSSWVVLPGLL